MNNSIENHRMELDAIKRQLMDVFKQISEAFGIKGLKQKILTVLFLDLGRPVSLNELTRLTHFSKSSVSRATRELLMEIPLLETVKKPNDKEKYYLIESDYVEFIASFLAKTVYTEAEPTIAATEDALKSLGQLRKKTTNPVLLEGIDSFQSQIGHIDRSFKKYLWFAKRILTYMKELEEEWSREHIDR
ncbi:MAG: hypothetical protein ACE5H4_13390 [Candidatus Thorarchaeota archaeon]